MRATNTKISGTKEWSVASVNCVTGCEHNCRYCYARAEALRYKRIANPEQWATPIVRPRELVRRRRKINGRVMFPTTHDITPSTLGPCLNVLGHLLRAGNEVLIVSKPHLDCVKELCRSFGQFQPQILFRFTIGAFDDRILSYWEPGAPHVNERLLSLHYAWNRGFATSVSAEPLLDAENVQQLVAAVENYVTDSIWIGKANKLRQRCVPGTDEAEIARIEAGQTDEVVRRVYGQLKDHPKIRWKESYKEVLGLAAATEAGLDR